MNQHPSNLQSSLRMPSENVLKRFFKKHAKRQFASITAINDFKLREPYATQVLRHLVETGLLFYCGRSRYDHDMELEMDVFQVTEAGIAYPDQASQAEVSVTYVSPGAVALKQPAPMPDYPPRPWPVLEADDINNIADGSEPIREQTGFALEHAWIRGLPLEDIARQTHVPDGNIKAYLSALQDPSGSPTDNSLPHPNLPLSSKTPLYCNFRDTLLSVLPQERKFTVMAEIACPQNKIVVALRLIARDADGTSIYAQWNRHKTKSQCKDIPAQFLKLFYKLDAVCVAWSRQFNKVNSAGFAWRVTTTIKHDDVVSSDMCRLTKTKDFTLAPLRHAFDAMYKLCKEAFDAGYDADHPTTHDKNDTEQWRRGAFLKVDIAADHSVRFQPKGMPFKPLSSQCKQLVQEGLAALSPVWKQNFTGVDIELRETIVAQLGAYNPYLGRADL